VIVGPLRGHSGVAQSNFIWTRVGPFMLLQIQDDICAHDIAPCPPCEQIVADLATGRASDFSRFLIALDERSRCNLFGYVVSDATLLKHAEAATQNASKITGIFVEDELRGVLEAYTGPNAVHAEVTVVVHQSWRRRGLGTALVRSAQKWALSQHLETLRLRFSSKNWPMRHLAQKARARLDMVADEMCADIDARRVW
jgi:GNAT superfamily N-acetyltransferase